MADPQKPTPKPKPKPPPQPQTASVRGAPLASAPLHEPIEEVSCRTTHRPVRPPTRRPSGSLGSHRATLLERINGRVLDPGTALTVKGVRPRSTVYVGPRLLVSRVARDDEATISTLEQVAERLGWAVTVSRGAHAR